jgi:hypothetical protein
MTVADNNLKLLASATKTASVTDATGVDFGSGDLLPTVYRAVVTAASASDTLDIKIQESADNSTWNDLAVFDQITAVGVYYVTARSPKRYRRYYATIAGTDPSFTFQIDVVPAGEYLSY